MLLTQAELSDQFRALGLAEGQTVMVHSSLSQLGYVLGGAQSVVSALLTVLGNQGTLVMPAFSPQVSDPAHWPDVAFNERELQKAREAVPVFDAAVTPTQMGAIPETFRNWPGTRRSRHPQTSVCARGPLAGYLTERHSLDWAQGPGSPFERLVEVDARMLLLGVGFNRATLLHYAESLVTGSRRKTRKFPWVGEAGRGWRQAVDVGDDLDTHFPIVGEQFVASGGASQLVIGQAKCTVMSSRALIDFARGFFEEVFSGAAQSIKFSL